MDRRRIVKRRTGKSKVGTSSVDGFLALLSPYGRIWSFVHGGREESQNDNSSFEDYYYYYYYYHYCHYCHLAEDMRDATKRSVSCSWSPPMERGESDSGDRKQETGPCPQRLSLLREILEVMDQDEGSPYVDQQIEMDVIDEEELLKDVDDQKPSTSKSTEGEAGASMDGEEVLQEEQALKDPPGLKEKKFPSPSVPYKRKNRCGAERKRARKAWLAREGQKDPSQGSSSSSTPPSHLRKGKRTLTSPEGEASNPPIKKQTSRWRGMK